MLWRLCSHDMDSLLQSLDSHLLPQQYFCWVRHVMEKVQWTLSCKWQPCLSWFRFIPSKWKQTMEILKMPSFYLDSVTMEMLLFPFLCGYKILGCYKNAHSFCHTITRSWLKLSIIGNIYLALFVMRYL